MVEPLLDRDPMVERALPTHRDLAFEGSGGTALAQRVGDDPACPPCRETFMHPVEGARGTRRTRASASVPPAALLELPAVQLVPNVELPPSVTLYRGGSSNRAKTRQLPAETPDGTVQACRTHHHRHEGHPPAVTPTASTVSPYPFHPPSLPGSHTGTRHRKPT